MSYNNQRVVRNCPDCEHWWFDRIRYGCLIDDNRPTNTTAQLGSESAVGYCKDYAERGLK